MHSKFFSSAIYAYRWMEWLIKFAVIWPAAFLMLLIVLMFRLDHSSPGKIMAQEIAQVTHDAGPGEYRVPDCEKKTSLTDTTLCTQTVLTDADGYAMHIDGALQLIPDVWIVMALAFTLLASFMGIRPYRDSGASMRSVLWLYGHKGTPAESTKENDNE